MSRGAPAPGQNTIHKIFFIYLDAVLQGDVHQLVPFLDIGTWIKKSFIYSDHGRFRSIALQDALLLLNEPEPDPTQDNPERFIAQAVGVLIPHSGVVPLDIACVDEMIRDSHTLPHISIAAIVTLVIAE